MKKIVFVIGTLGNGGAERVISTLANNFSEKGYEVSIITIYGNKQDYPIKDKIDLFSIYCSNKVRLFRPIERIRKIKKLVMDINPDVIVSFLADVNIHAIVACSNLNYPIIVSERNDPRRNPEQKWIRKLRDIVYKKVSGIVFQTQDAKEYFKDVLPATIKTALISNPIPDCLPVNNCIENNRLITACRLNPQKNLSLMIRAVADVISSGINCTLDIYGEGPLRKQLQEEIIELGLENNVFLRGFYKDIHRKIAESTAFIISSDYEGISNSMLEALAIGTPVIATDCPVGGARQFIESGKNGILVPVGNKDELSRAIIYVLQNQDAARQMGKEAMKIRDLLNANIILDQWIKFINLVNRKEY